MKKVSHIRLSLEAVLEDGTIVKGSTREVPNSIGESEDCRFFAHIDMASQSDNSDSTISLESLYIDNLFRRLKFLPISEDEKILLNNPKDLLDLCFERLLIKLKD